MLVHCLLTSWSSQTTKLFLPQTQFLNKRFCLGDHHPDQVGEAEEAHVVHDARPLGDGPEQSKLRSDLLRVEEVVEETWEEVDEQVWRVKWSADVVLLLLIPDGGNWCLLRNRVNSRRCYCWYREGIQLLKFQLGNSIED